ncbi:hypothetical protein [Pseudobutyrivibrio ruminis]|uniref:hypothetical protein n=1 Tax=Pseudobutyrivibrio ruminis TaxID=46206 RepID=UPI00051BAD64|nr:hypothetical protein [Pseudobutyrivibrio ruminis]
MYLRGWKYEGRKIADKLHEQILGIVEILNDPQKVGDKTWPALQKYISDELGIATGQVRTIKRMMEEFDIVKKGSLNANEVPTAESIYTENGKTLLELIATEKLMRENPTKDNVELMQEIRSIYQLYYQKVLLAYSYNDEGQILHPLKATLKMINRYRYLNYWEWYLLNTIVHNDDNEQEEQEFDRFLNDYRTGNIRFKDSDIIENQLSHSYVLGNFEYAGLICIDGKKTDLKATINEKSRDIVNEILKG